MRILNFSNSFFSRKFLGKVKFNSVNNIQRAQKSKYTQKLSKSEFNEARIMNKFVLNNTDKECDNTFRNACYTDYLRLTNSNYKLGFSRVKWINPKDGKVYHILKEGDLVAGKQPVRILDNTGKFIKNAEIQSKTIVVFELESDMRFSELNNLKHSDLTSLFIKRYNPFANIKVCTFKNKNDLHEKLSKSIDSNVAAISCAFAATCPVKPKGKLQQLYYRLTKKHFRTPHDELYKLLGDLLDQKEKKLSDIPENIRIFMASGNSGKHSYNKYLALDRVEGVGSIEQNNKISEFSSSRNAFFTQHYEHGNYQLIQVPEGFIIAETDYTDIPHSSDKYRSTKNVCGTSYAVSVRAAKVVLNQMMEGIL